MNPYEPSALIPYSLDAIEALHSHWNVPYNHVPSPVSIESYSMTFSPMIDDESWKGTFTPTLL
jgi:lysyl-tRNA synthetase class I